MDADALAGPQLVSVVHSCMALEKPELGAHVLGYLESGSTLQLLAREKGFFTIQLTQERIGFIPAAVCDPLAIKGHNGALPETTIIQPVSLYRAPIPGAQFVTPILLTPNEELIWLERVNGFAHIQRHNEQEGYIPEILCGRPQRASDGRMVVRVRQSVSLYRSPLPGAQWSSEWIVSPTEPLAMLGRDGHFLLVQRDSGQIGYIPRVLCGQPAVTDALLPIGPLDLGWVVLGVIWGGINWVLLELLLKQSSWLPPEFYPYASIGLLLSIVLLLWFGSTRRMPARSCALGLMLLYAVLHVSVF